MRRAAPSCPPFFFMYKCMFEVLGIILPLTTFQCALLEHLNVAFSQLHWNSWAMVQTFEIMCPFLNIQPSAPIFLFFFQMKLSGKIGPFFQVLVTDVMADGMPLMLNKDGELRVLFYWQSDPTRFKSYDEDLVTLVERMGPCHHLSLLHPLEKRINLVEVTFAAVEATVPATQADSVVVSSSTIVIPLLSAGVAITGAPIMLPPSSSAQLASLSTFLAAVASPSSFSRPRVKVAKWRATTQTLWQVEWPKVANATIVFAEVVRSNRQLSSKVGGVLAKLLRTQLDGDELFKHCKDMQAEKMDLGGKVESVAAERDEIAKVVAYLEALLKESESKLAEFELWVTKEKKANRELEEELLLYKKEVV
ncbi:hypothetical protein HKD37_09G025605 [Glycine soja]